MGGQVSDAAGNPPIDPQRSGPSAGTCQLSVVPMPNYLHFVVTGENSADNVRSYIGDIVRECAARGCWRLLIEERLHGERLGTHDVFAIAERASTALDPRLQAVAYVDVHAAGDLMGFAEDIAANRGFPLRVFGSVDEARAWLSR
jgi:hypothetical protein